MLAVFVKLNSSDCKQNVKINVFEKKKTASTCFKETNKRKKKKEKRKT
jgi:hypothetical protein